ncbi:MAG: DUF4252 domain-containing protein [Bacteroidaceae bacterium]|nr:DUF4252 domain-containing protein [Bacteroidaceae bacterium]
MNTLRRFIFTLIVFLTILPAHSEDSRVMTDDALFKQLKEMEDAEFVSVNSFMMSMGRMMASGEEKTFLEKISSMRIVELSACSAEHRSEFVDLLSSIELQDYEPAQEEVVGNQRTRVFVKVKDELIRKFIIAQLGEKEFLLMQINGKLTTEDMENLARSKSSSK